MTHHVVLTESEVRLSGIFDGSRAMEVVNHLRCQPAAGVILDFSDVESFEDFGVEVLVRHLAEPGGAQGRVRCRGLPPCVAARLEEAGVARAPTARRPRWAP